MRALIEATAASLVITQDLGLGMMLWLTHFFPGEDWAVAQRRRSLAVLDRMWREDGYFGREPNLPHVKFAFTNYGVSVGLQAVDAMAERVPRLNSFFDHYRSGDEYDREAITHVMACSSHFPGYLIRPAAHLAGASGTPSNSESALGLIAAPCGPKHSFRTALGR